MQNESALLPVSFISTRACLEKDQLGMHWSRLSGSAVMCLSVSISSSNLQSYLEQEVNKTNLWSE